MSAPTVLSLTYIRLCDLRPAETNPKRHATDRLIGLMVEYGWTKPVLVDERTERLAAGHGAVEAAIEMKARGMAPPANVLVDDDGEWLLPVTRGWASRSDVRAKAYRIGDNKVGEDGGWHDRELAADLEDIQADDTELFATLGYDAERLDDLFRHIGEDGTVAGKDQDRPHPATSKASNAGEDQGDDDQADDPAERLDDDGIPTVGEARCPACGHAFVPAG